MIDHMDAAGKQASGFLKRGLAAVAILTSPAALYAQGCAMCYQSVAASGPRSIHALRSGILILMFPPVLITTAIVYLAYRKRNKFNGT
jgi:hypothetical protein